jgi:transcriptional regulator with GAF, ATPase, and Fis domain
MKESVVIDIDSTLLPEAIKIAAKKGVSLSTIISGALEWVIKSEKGVFQCPKNLSQGVCIENLPSDATLEKSKDDLEIQMIKRALLETNAHAANASKLLGIAKSGMSQKMKKHGLEKYWIITEHNRNTTV